MSDYYGLFLAITVALSFCVGWYLTGIWRRRRP